MNGTLTICGLCDRPGVSTFTKGFRQLVDVTNGEVQEWTYHFLSIDNSIHKLCYKCIQDLRYVGSLLYQWQKKIRLSPTYLPVKTEIDLYDGVQEDQHLSNVYDEDVFQDEKSCPEYFESKSVPAKVETDTDWQDEDQIDIHAEDVIGKGVTCKKLQPDRLLRATNAASLKQTVLYPTIDKQSEDFISPEKILSSDHLPSAELGEQLKDNDSILGREKLKEKCPKCEKSLIDIKDHLKRVHGIGESKRYSCHLCPAAFWKKSLLSDHERIHTNEKPYKCSECDRIFRCANFLRKHKKVHQSEKKRKCRYCSKCFTSYNGKIAHEKNDHENIIAEPFQSPSPNKSEADGSYGTALPDVVEKDQSSTKTSTCDEEALQDDLSHPDSSLTVRESIPIKIDTENISIFQDEYQVNDNIKDVKTKSKKVKNQKQAAKTDKQSTTSQQCTTSPHEFDKQALCSTCGQQCEDYNSLKKHLLSNHPFVCSICSVEFPDEEQLKAHDSHLCREKIKEECPKCGKSLIDIKDHLRRVHGIGEKKKYSCHLCPAAFWKKSLLSDHERIHTNEKPYKCSECDRAFRCANFLRKHKKVHHGEKNHVCSYCGKSFASIASKDAHEKNAHEKNLLNNQVREKHDLKKANSLLKIKRKKVKKPKEDCPKCEKPFRDIQNHMRRVHGEGEGKEFLCRFCPAAFWNKPRLNDHERLHTNEKPYKCTDCDLAFRCADYLRRHKSIHTGEKNYKCSFCGKSFRSDTNMHVHEKLVHKKMFYACPKRCGKHFSRRKQASEHGEDCFELPNLGEID